MIDYGTNTDKLSTGERRGEAVIQAVTAYLFPLAIALLSLAAIFLLPNRHLNTVEAYHIRNTALVEGGLLTLSVFILVIAISSKQRIYLLLSIWMIGNLRLGSMALGWDTHWLGHTLPVQWMPLIRQVTLATYFLLSYALFSQLFRTSINPIPFARVRKLIGIGGLLLLAGSFVLSPRLFAPAMWGLSAVGLCTCVLIIADRIRLESANSTRFWPLVLLSMALCVLISGVLQAVMGRNSFIDTFNGIVALFLSNVLVALTLGEHLHEERQKRILAQQKLKVDHTLIPIGMFSLNSSSTIERSNTVFRQLVGIDLNNKQAQPSWSQLFPAIDWEHVIRQSSLGKETETQRLPFTNTHALPTQFSLRAARVGHSIEVSIRDISARAKVIRELQLLADNDPVTNVLNQRGTEKAIAASLARIHRGESCVLAYLDLNYVKYVNGTYGHASGDTLLREVSARIESELMPDHEVGRLGSDEFVIMFNNTSAEQAQMVAEKIIASLNQQAIYAGNRSFNLQSAIGMVELSADLKVEDVLSAANRACRDARRGHKPVTVYKQGSRELHDHAEELRLFKELEDGSSSAFYLEMQPLMSLKNPLESLNFEILLRARDSKGELITPGKIIALAEESGTISIIDKWVFGATLKWLDTHHTKLKNTQQININLSGVSLNDDKFIDELFAILEQYEHLTSRLCVEITEGVALQDLERTRQFMKRLQHKGARIALDDFGAGYTSFSYLRELPADAIKIDGALIKDMLHKDTNIAIVRTIVELARNLGMVSIAEWVEDVETLRMLSDMQVDCIQGYVISAARPATDILAANDIRDLVIEPQVIVFINEQYPET